MAKNDAMDFLRDRITVLSIKGDTVTRSEPSDELLRAVVAHSGPGAARPEFRHGANRRDRRGPSRQRGVSSVDATILSADVLTPTQEAELDTVPGREIDPDVLVLYPQAEEDPAAPCRLYVVCVPMVNDAVFVGITATPAPTQAPTADELKQVARSVVANAA